MSGPPSVEGIVNRVAGRLRFPWLLLFTAVLFVVNLVVPDPIPFVDEIVLGLVTLILATWRTKIEQRTSATRPERGAGPVVDVPPSDRGGD